MTGVTFPVANKSRSTARSSGFVVVPYDWNFCREKRDAKFTGE